MADLRQIFVASASMFADQEQAPSSLNQLIESGAISKEFADGKNGKYKFRIQPAGHELEAYADPIDPDAGLKHFMIDKEGTIRFEPDKPATASSKAYLD